MKGRIGNRSSISSTSTIASSSTVKQKDLKLHTKKHIDYEDDEERDSGINLNTNSLNTKVNKSLTHTLASNKMASRKLKLNSSDVDDDEYDLYENSTTQHSSNTMPRYLKHNNNFQSHYQNNEEPSSQRLLPTSKNRIFIKSNENNIYTKPNENHSAFKEEQFKCKFNRDF